MIEATVTDIAVKQRGTVSGPFGSSISKKFFVEQGVPVIRGNNLSLGTDGPRFHDSDFVFVTQEKADELAASECRSGDLIFTARGTIGQVGLIPDDARFPRYILSANQLRLRPNADIADALYLYYYFSTSEMVEFMQGLNAGSALPNMNLGTLRSLPVSLPSLPEQRSIAHILGTLDDKIELNRRMNETLEAMARALFKSWFVDFEPVRAKMEGRWRRGEFLPGLPTEHYDLFPDRLVDSGLGEIPAGWEVKPFGELLENVIGGDWGEASPDSANTEGVSIIRGTDIPHLRNGGVGAAPLRYTTEKKTERRMLQDGDIVIEVSGGSPTQPTGRSMIITTDILDRFSTKVVCASFCRRFRPQGWTEGLFGFQHLEFLNSIGKMWEYQLQSTGISNFQTKRFLEEECVIWPGEPLAAEFSNLITPIVRHITRNDNKALAVKRDVLLPMLVSGELRVVDFS